VAFAIDGDALSRLQAGSSAGQFIHALVAFRDDGEPAGGATDTTRNPRFAVMDHDNDHDGSYQHGNHDDSSGNLAASGLQALGVCGQY